MLGLFSCELNEATPEYTVVGDAYSTVVEFSVDNDEPLKNEEVNVEITYANYSEDPLDYLELSSITNGDTTLVERVEGSSAFGQITETVSITPDVALFGGEVTLFVELYSDKLFPQVEILNFDLLQSPDIAIDSLINTLPFDNALFENAEISYNIDLNSSGVNYRDLRELRVYYSINGGAEVASDTLNFDEGTSSTTLTVPVTIPEMSVGEDVTFRFEVEAISDETASVTADPLSIEAVTMLDEITDEAIGILPNDTVGYDFEALDNVDQDDPDTVKDFVVTDVTAEGIFTVESLNATTFVTITNDLYETANLSTIADAFNKGASSSVLDDVNINDVYVAKLRDSDNYVIIKITGKVALVSGGTPQNVLQFNFKYVP